MSSRGCGSGYYGRGGRGGRGGQEAGREGLTMPNTQSDTDGMQTELQVDIETASTAQEEEPEYECIPQRHKPSLSINRSRQVRAGLFDLQELRRTMDLSAPVTYVVLDIEWNERNKNQCTELGVALLHKPANGVAAFQKCTHFTVREHFYKRNKKYVVDHKDDFNPEFGKKSTPIREERLGAAMHSILRNARGNGETLLVVHGGKEDMEWLGKWEADFLGMEVLDTQSMEQGLYFESSGYYRDPPSLHSVLSNYGIASKNLHNAGNDAGYTMKALQAMAAVKEGEYGIVDL